MKQKIDKERINQQYVDKVYITLGRGCNFKCSYCLQLKKEKRLKIGSVLNEGIFDYLEGLANQRPRDAKPMEIFLFGGEPLLYYRNIQRIISNCHPRNSRYKVNTNGSLLVKDYVDFFNAENVVVCLSHDGPNTLKTRGKDVLCNPEILPLIQRIKNLEVHSVITALSQDIYGVSEYLTQKIGTSFRLKPLFLNVDASTPQWLYAFDLDAWTQTCFQMQEAAIRQLGGRSPIGFEAELSQKYLNRLVTAKKIGSAGRFVCGAPVNHRYIDIQGNVYLCNNAKDPVGTIESTDESVLGESVVRFKALIEQNKTVCNRCQYKVLCRGLCPYKQIDRIGAEYCAFMMIFYRAVERVYKELHAKDNPNC